MLASRPAYYELMPVDRAVIKTQLNLDPALFDDPLPFLDRRCTPIRASKLKNGHHRGRPSRKLTLQIHSYRGVAAHLDNYPDEPRTHATIDFNPSTCLYGHNGGILSVDEFIDAIGLMVSWLVPLLSDHEDWPDLVPGVRSPGVAYWHFLEIPLHHYDLDGRLLAGFRHARHPRFRKAARHWPGSMKLQNAKGTLCFSIYRKAEEMVAHSKLPERSAADYSDVLRLEVGLKDDMLLEYLGNERNAEEIDGTRRLVRFYPEELIEGHRRSYGELEGVFQSEAPPAPIDGREKSSLRGRFLAGVALDEADSGDRPPTSFHRLLDHIKFYTGASSDTIGKIRKAGLAELSRSSTIDKQVVLSDKAYRFQQRIQSQQIEQMVCHDLGDIFEDDTIRRAYDPPRQGQWSFPRDLSYIR